MREMKIKKEKRMTKDAPQNYQFKKKKNKTKRALCNRAELSIPPVQFFYIPVYYLQYTVVHCIPLYPVCAIGLIYVLK